jgi:hypothetical protein
MGLWKPNRLLRCLSKQQQQRREQRREQRQRRRQGTTQSQNSFVPQPPEALHQHQQEQQEKQAEAELQPQASRLRTVVVVLPVSVEDIELLQEEETEKKTKTSSSSSSSMAVSAECPPFLSTTTTTITSNNIVTTTKEEEDYEQDPTCPFVCHDTDTILRLLPLSNHDTGPNKNNNKKTVTAQTRAQAQIVQPSRTKSILNVSAEQYEQQQDYILHSLHSLHSPAAVGEQEEPWACGMDPYFMEKSLRPSQTNNTTNNNTNHEAYTFTPTAKARRRSRNRSRTNPGTPDTLPVDNEEQEEEVLELDALLGNTSANTLPRTNNRRHHNKNKNNKKKHTTTAETDIVSQAISDLTLGLVPSTLYSDYSDYIQAKNQQEQKSYQHAIRELFCYSI